MCCGVADEVGGGRGEGEEGAREGRGREGGSDGEVALEEVEVGVKVKVEVEVEEEEKGKRRRETGAWFDIWLGFRGTAFRDRDEA